MLTALRIDPIELASTKGIGWGVLGGLAGTVAMDIILMGTSPVLGLNGIQSFSVIGDTAARFFTLLGVAMPGGVPAGLTVHYLAGPLLGALFGAAVTRFKALWPGTLKKGIGLAILYVQVASQPLLALTPLLMHMNVQETAFWYALSFGMHCLWGAILGAVVTIGLRPAASRQSGQRRAI